MIAGGVVRCLLFVVFHSFLFFVFCFPILINWHRTWVDGFVIIRP